MGNNLHQLTEANFDMNKVVGERLELYRQLMGSGNVQSKSD